MELSPPPGAHTRQVTRPLPGVRLHLWWFVTCGVLHALLSVLVFVADVNLWHLDWNRDGGPGPWSIVVRAGGNANVAVLLVMFALRRKRAPESQAHENGLSLNQSCFVLHVLLSVLVVVAAFNLWQLDWNRDGGPGPWSVVVLAGGTANVAVLLVWFALRHNRAPEPHAHENRLSLN